MAGTTGRKVVAPQRRLGAGCSDDDRVVDRKGPTGSLEGPQLEQLPQPHLTTPASTSERRLECIRARATLEVRDHECSTSVVANGPAADTAATDAAQEPVEWQPAG